jgi:enoyl-CoA hydratase/carnithine racemase
MNRMPAAEYQTILVDVSEGVALVTLNRPDQLNAFTPRMGRELGHAFTTFDASDEVRAIVVTGAGRGFCAGAALDDEGSTFKGLGTTGEEIGPPVSDICPWELATPVLAAINGPAVGLGLTYPMLWDIRVAAEDAKLSFAFTRRGLIPEANSLWLLARAIGASRALELLLTGRTFSGADAAEWGLVSQALPAGKVLDATMDIARDIAVNTSPASVAVTKRMFYEQLASPDRAGSRAAERAAFMWFTSQADAREGIASFLQRRQPAWNMSKRDAPPAT